MPAAQRCERLVARRPASPTRSTSGDVGLADGLADGLGMSSVPTAAPARDRSASEPAVLVVRAHGPAGLTVQRPPSCAAKVKARLDERPVGVATAP
jgi:hypothetical protein